MVAKNEQGMYVFGEVSGMELIESVYDDAPIIELDGEHSICFDAEESKLLIKFLSRFVEMAEQGRLSTKIKPVEKTEAIPEPSKTVRIPDGRGGVIEKELTDEGNGGVSEGLETDSPKDEG